MGFQPTATSVILLNDLQTLPDLAQRGKSPPPLPSVGVGDSCHVGNYLLFGVGKESLRWELDFVTGKQK